tara:strand:+ start:591 stop:914 length:324 start_codon:yes stop_codon:yes gene_type:complete
MKYCKWCGAATNMEPLLLADSPILEEMEKKINKHGRDKIWGENGDWSKVKLDSELEAELLVYDQLLSSVSKKTVCMNCIVEDEKLWKKYYDKDIDPDGIEIRFDADF